MQSKFKKFFTAIILCCAVFPVSNYKPVFHPHDLACMTANIFFEARGEGKKGMEVVAKVTMNRVLHKKYPPNVCAVIFQRKQFSWTHEQRWDTIWKVMNGRMQGFSKLDRAAYHQAKKIAQKALTEQWSIDLPDNALWYHTTQVKPVWRKKLQKVATVGKHIIYKEK